MRICYEKIAQFVKCYIIGKNSYRNLIAKQEIRRLLMTKSVYQSKICDCNCTPTSRHKTHTQV